MEVGALSQEPAKTEAVSSESGKKRKKKQEEEEKKFVMSDYLGDTKVMPIDYLAIDSELTHGQVSIVSFFCVAFFLEGSEEW